MLCRRLRVRQTRPSFHPCGHPSTQTSFAPSIHAAHQRAAWLPQPARGGVQLPAGEGPGFLGCPLPPGIALSHTADTGSGLERVLVSVPVQPWPWHVFPCTLFPPLSQVFSTGGYVKNGHRQALLQHLAGSARAAWPQCGPFTFKNPRRHAVGSTVERAAPSLHIAQAHSPALTLPYRMQPLQGVWQPPA